MSKRLLSKIMCLGHIKQHSPISAPPALPANARHVPHQAPHSHEHIAIHTVRYIPRRNHASHFRDTTTTITIPAVAVQPARNRRA